MKKFNKIFENKQHFVSRLGMSLFFLYFKTFFSSSFFDGVMASQNLNVVEAAKVIDEKLGGVTLSDVPI